MRLSYEVGTVVVADPSSIPDYITFDSRTASYRSEGYLYSRLKADFPDAKDDVFKNEEINLKHKENLRSYQKRAVDLWASNSYSGVVVLPTAAGKTHIGMEAMSRLSTSTIVIAPTIELVQQWRDRLQKTFGVEVGQIGGGEKEIRDVSVSTYDSAYLMAEKLGNRFRLLLVDEVHHLAAERYIEIARMYASPYRMGLTATYERTDMLHERLQQFMGGKVFELGYEELTEYLADYQIIRIPVELEQEEEEEYDKNRKIFLTYLRKHRMRMRGPWDFEKFILSSWNPEGREALIAWRKARSIAFNSRVKVDTVRYVLSKHRGEKTIIFSLSPYMASSTSRTEEFMMDAIFSSTAFLSPGFTIGFLAIENMVLLTFSESRGEGFLNSEALNIISARPLIIFGFCTFSSIVFRSSSISPLLFPVLLEKTSVIEEQ